MAQRTPEVPAQHRSPAYEIVADLCRLVRSLCDAQRVTVWVYDAFRDVVRPYASSSPDAVIPRGSPLGRIPLDDIPAFRSVLFEGQTLDIDDAITDPRFPTDLAEEFAIRSVRCERLAIDEPVGIIHIEPIPGPLPEDARNILSTLASAVSEAWARREAERQRATAELLVDLAASAADQTAASNLLHEAWRRLARHLGVTPASFYLKYPETGTVVPRMSAHADGTIEPDLFHTFRSTVSTSQLEPALSLESPLALGPDDRHLAFCEVWRAGERVEGIAVARYHAVGAFRHG
jgi:hypothetical protein